MFSCGTLWRSGLTRSEGLCRRAPSTLAPVSSGSAPSTQDQARRAALLDRLDALCEHVSGRPALGYEPGDPLPAAALEEADGFTDSATALLVADYRARRAVSAG
ncbi:hypothetical protein OG217_05465 [Streptomyces sp. NBC_01023]|uniref:hypothetical protein n=1 Tax=Streptomyces sp. NBC_01023 TaxID=2903724 RepID=UPI003863B85B|nr:hypothetical protein OG217_05465 [Streptomyces sp. NBC_01023]